jgi:hypothetical protein
MSQMQSMAGSPPGVRSGAGQAGAIPIVTLGLSLSLFFVISYVICIAGYLLLPGFPVQHAALSIFLPGFELLSWRSFCLGMAESFSWGWYIALAFGALYNFISRRVDR